MIGGNMEDVKGKYISADPLAFTGMFDTADGAVRKTYDFEQ